MTLKRTSIQFDPKDMRALAHIAKAESERVGTRVTAAALVRRLVKEYLRSQEGGK